MQRWQMPRRPNYRGENIPAVAGVYFVLPTLALTGLLAVMLPDLRRACLLQWGAIAVFAALGLLDDLCGSREFGGIRGHVTALLRHRKVTTGLVKLLAGGLAALALGRLAAAGWSEAFLNGAVIALSANLVNLLDLRPGRALKVFFLGGILLAPSLRGLGSLPLLAIAVPAAVYAPFDLRARAMMGDTGSNALGAALGMAATLHLGLAGRIGLLAALLSLHALSEFVSFSRLIERGRVLRFLDQLGRGELSKHG